LSQTISTLEPHLFEGLFVFPPLRQAGTCGATLDGALPISGGKWLQVPLGKEHRSSGPVSQAETLSIVVDDAHASFGSFGGQTTVLSGARRHGFLEHSVTDWRLAVWLASGEQSSRLACQEA